MIHSDWKELVLGVSGYWNGGRYDWTGKERGIRGSFHTPSFVITSTSFSYLSLFQTVTFRVSLPLQWMHHPLCMLKIRSPADPLLHRFHQKIKESMGLLLFTDAHVQSVLSFSISLHVVRYIFPRLSDRQPTVKHQPISGSSKPPTSRSARQVKR